jgi:DNA-binding NarL/FixJ family response regulator
MGTSRVLVGREAQVEALQEFLHGAPAGRPPVMLVAGEAGVGKTALVDQVLAGAGQPVRRGWAAGRKSAVYEVLAQVLTPTASGQPLSSGGPVDKRALVRSADPGGPVDERALVPSADPGGPGRELALVLPGLGPPPAEVSRSELAAAVAAVLAQMAGPGRLAVFLDDLQWADDATLDLLPALAGAISGGPVALIGCYRGDELPRDHRLRAARAELRRARQLAEIDLAPLPGPCVTAILAALLGAEPEPDLVSAVAGRADGIPFAVEELAAALRLGGHLDYREGTVGLAGTGHALIPEGIREAVLFRAGQLGPDAAPVLDAAAVAGNEFDVELVLAVAGTPEWPEQLASSGLVSAVSDGRAAFRHALTRDAAYAAVPWSRRRALHQAIAGRLAAGHAPPALIAEHLLAARDLAGARAALVAAAAADYAVHAYRDAARALRTAMDLWPPGGEDAERLTVVDQLARCAEMCSEHAEAVTLLRELADGYREAVQDRAARDRPTRDRSTQDGSAQDRPARDRPAPDGAAQGRAAQDRLAAAQDRLAGAQRRLALAHELLGQWDAALAAREAAAVAFAAAGQPAEAAVERLAAAAHLRSAASFSAALDTLAAARPDAEASGRADLLLRIDGLRGNVLSRMGRTREGLATVRASLEAALAQALAGPAAELYQRLADSLEHAGEYAAATAAYTAGYEFCQEHGEQTAGQLCRACVTAVLFVAGHWDRALEVCADAAGADGAVPHARAVGTGIGGLIHAFRGSAATARSDLLAATSIATRIELTPMELISAWGLCVLDDAAGAPEAAVARARRILARWEESGERHYTIAIAQWASTLFAEAGDPAGARACAAVLARIAEATAQPEALAALAHALGETAHLDGAPATAAQQLLRAAESFASLGLPLATAQARRRAAAALAAAGETGPAADQLRAAHEIFAGLGADRAAGQCAAGLAALGRKPPRRAGGGRRAGALSRRESEVMALVAQGLTSRDIGGRLFLSPRTVEMHVQNSLDKLGCRTRAEAVRRLTELGTWSGTAGPVP